ncbi:MAG: hypothetical protein ABFS35_10375 [Bacteroidota bacterium]
MENKAEENLLNGKPKYKSVTLAESDVFFELDDENEFVVRTDYLKVKEQDRYKGLGTCEVENIINWAKENGAKEVIVESSRPTIFFCRKMGFDVLDQGSKYSTGIFTLS